MTTLERLEQYAHDKRIKIVHSKLVPCAAAATRFRGRKVIWIDYAGLATDARRTTALAHEIAHMESGSTNSSYTRYTPDSKTERRAERYMLEALLPKGVLDSAIAAHGGRLWEVAEDLGVTEGLIRRAVRYYKSKEGD